MDVTMYPNGYYRLKTVPADSADIMRVSHELCPHV
jgi:hypothetical protein